MRTLTNAKLLGHNELLRHKVRNTIDTELDLYDCEK